MRENTVDIIKILSTGKGTDRLCRSPRNHHGLCCPLSLEASTGVDGVGHSPYTCTQVQSGQRGTRTGRESEFKA